MGISRNTLDRWLRLDEWQPYSILNHLGRLDEHRQWLQQGSVLISSNRPVEEWDEVFGDQVTAAILDRLLHHSHVVTIRGDSYRLREKRRSGLFCTQAGGSSPPMPTKED